MFIASASGRTVRLATNSPVSETLRTLSFQPSLQNITMGGRSQTMLKKL
jgi:hypothetical protein